MLFVFVLTSCCTPKTKYKYIDKEVYCNSTIIPVFPDFDFEKPIQHPDNVANLLEMLSLWKKYTDELNAEIACYRKQTNNTKVEELEKDKDAAEISVSGLEEIKINISEDK